MDQAKRPDQRQIRQGPGHRVESLAESPAVKADPWVVRPSLPWVPGPCTLLQPGGDQKAGSGEEPARGGQATSSGSGSKGLSRSFERTGLKTGGILPREGTLHTTYACQTGNRRGTILYNPARHPSGRPTPQLEPKVIHTKEDSPLALGNPRDRR